MHLALLLLALAAHPWPQQARSGDTIATRFAPPAGYARVAAPEGSFGAWLRSLPLLPGRNTVHLFDGRVKANQTAHVAVLDVDVGARDLQQCADAAIRLLAEYRFAGAGRDDICFKATSGDELPWRRFRGGERPALVGERLTWARRGGPDASWRSFRSYLDRVFTWAGSASLARSARRVDDLERPEPGDVFIQGGAPGHVVTVVDVAEDGRGARVFLLAQSYMPAQQLHVLANPAQSSPWYDATDRGPLVTPEWTFARDSLRRLAGVDCP